MSQTSVDTEEAVAFEGLIADSVHKDIISRLANEAATPFIPFGKLVVANASDGDDQCQLPGATGEVTGNQALGIAIADVSVETDPDIAWGHYKQFLGVPIMRRGRIWVIAEDEVTTLAKDVFVRFADPGGSAPLASLGSFRTDADTADAVQLTQCRWLTTTTGTGTLAKLEINLP